MTVFNVFELILTVQISKFHIGTRNLVKIEVVEEEMLYKFDFWRKLIWSLDEGEKRALTGLNIIHCALD